MHPFRDNGLLDNINGITRNSDEMRIQSKREPERSEDSPKPEGTSGRRGEMRNTGHDSIQIKDTTSISSSLSNA